MTTNYKEIYLRITANFDSRKLYIITKNIKISNQIGQTVVSKKIQYIKNMYGLSHGSSIICNVHDIPGVFNDLQNQIESYKCTYVRSYKPNREYIRDPNYYALKCIYILIKLYIAGIVSNIDRYDTYINNYYYTFMRCLKIYYCGINISGKCTLVTSLNGMKCIEFFKQTTKLLYLCLNCQMIQHESTTQQPFGTISDQLTKMSELLGSQQYCPSEKCLQCGHHGMIECTSIKTGNYSFTVFEAGLSSNINMCHLENEYVSGINLSGIETYYKIKKITYLTKSFNVLTIDNNNNKIDFNSSTHTISLMERTLKPENVSAIFMRKCFNEIDIEKAILSTFNYPQLVHIIMELLNSHLITNIHVLLQSNRERLNKMFIWKHPQKTHLAHDQRKSMLLQEASKSCKATYIARRNMTDFTI